MGIQYLGYRPIQNLDTASDIKLLNDTLQGLWVKIMGNLTAKDMTNDAQSVVAGAFEQQLNAIDTQLTQISKMDAEQNGRILVLEDQHKVMQETMDALMERVTALETRINELETGN